MNDFEQFRAAYPKAKREAGARAEAIFAGALQKAPLATLLAALEEHKRSEQWELPRYIPLMTTWLLMEHWRQVSHEPEEIPDSRLTPWQLARKYGYK